MADDVLERIRREPRVADAPRPSEWTVKLIRDLEWKRFEELVCGFWVAKGYDAKLTSAGADGGVDVMIHKAGVATPFAVAQCKSWRNEIVGVSQVRELWGVVHHYSAEMGLFYGLSGFTQDAVAFAQQKHLKLFTAEHLFEQVQTLTPEQRRTLLDQVCRGDYLTPTCPRCDTKMVRRPGNPDFWGCTSFPSCRHMFPLSTRAA